MRQIFTRRVVVTRLGIAAVFVASLALGIAAWVLPHHPTHAASAANGPALVETYTLITGDRIRVTHLPDGKPSVTVLPASGSGGAGGGGGGCPFAGPSGTPGFDVQATAQHLYVVPDDAAGYLGAPLSIDLFDVNTLSPDTSTGTSASTPQQLRVDYTAGSAQHLPPGLSTAANGAVVVANPRQFGAALAQAWRTDSTGGTSQLFAGIARIAPAARATTSQQTASTAATPAPGQLYTVTIKGFDRLGQRAESSLVEMMNADDMGLYLSLSFFYQGTVAFSVPAGHYSITAPLKTFYPDGSFDTTMTVLPEVDVTHDTTVILDARMGQPLSVTTPQPAVPDFRDMSVQRDDVRGDSDSFDYATFCPIALYATPTAPVSVGTFHFLAAYHLMDPTGGFQYTYDLLFPYANAIPSNLAQTVTQDQLAAIDARYHSPVPGRAEFVIRIGEFTPWQVSGIGGSAAPIGAPLERTEYVQAQPDLHWGAQVFFGAFGWVLGSNETFQPGQQTREDWMAQPMPSGDVDQLPDVFGGDCLACREGDTLSFWMFPHVDNDGHFMVSNLDPFDPSVESLTLYQNGTQVGQTTGPAYGSTFALSAQPATYQLVYDVSEPADPEWPTSTHLHTAWTFASQERAPDQLPPGWTCPAPDSSGGCNIEPLLFASYNTGAGLDDVVPAGGPATVEVHVHHQLGVPDAANAPITQFRAQVSYDDGQTWQNAPATDLGQGVYRLQYTQPALAATNGFATLRIQASDSAGSAIDQTITRAYPLAVTPPAQLPTTPNQGNQPACATASVAPYVHCLAQVNTDAGISLSQPHGLAPADIQSAYHLSPTAGQGRTVAIVDAFDDPNAEADLATYRAQYGLPACTSANGCFTKVNQRGETTNLPMPDPGWALEISLDLDAVSATCPACHLLLVEADSAFGSDLTTAVQTAQRLGANVISNSYGTFGEFSGEQVAERAYRDLKVPFVVASGDYGYGNTGQGFGAGGPAFPAVSQYAVAVGGTTLTRANTPRGWSESAWQFATSGCSAYIHKPGWQKDALCSMRTVADVAAVADPETGLAVYDTYVFDGWLQVGGTSLSAPIIAAVFAMAGDGSTVRYASTLYSHTSALYDVTSGANGLTCSGTYLCTALPGYDGPTGLGTPNGTNAFA